MRAASLVVWLLCLASACRDPSPYPILIGVVPDVVSTRDETTTTLSGMYLVKQVGLDLDSHDPPQIDDEFEVSIDGDPLQQESIRWMDPQTMELDIPAGLELGPHGVKVTIPDGRSMALASAFSVVDCVANVCGDGVCCATAGEDACGCPEDCGPETCADVCGDLSCTGTETSDSCPVDCACPPECTTCLGDGTCQIDCSDATCGATCPAGRPCIVNCIGDAACETILVDCSLASECVISCIGAEACDSGVLCGGSSCHVDCIGSAACEDLGVDCSATICDITCEGENACRNHVCCSDASCGGCTSVNGGCCSCSGC